MRVERRNGEVHLCYIVHVGMECVSEKRRAIKELGVSFLTLI